jgi:D-arabinose 5-phosphate isomerase GutQ
MSFILEETIIMKKEAIEMAKKAYLTESECILKMFDYFDEEVYSKAVELLKNAPRIAAAGCGHSGIMCQHFTHLMCCIERPARFISPAEAVHGGTGYLQEGDVMVLASRGGKTQELMPILDICKKKGVKVITITENTESPLALGADVVIKQYVNKETDKYNCQGTTSSVALAVIFHVLQTALIEETGFQNEQFAIVHPGGAVGERLNKNN